LPQQSALHPTMARRIDALGALTRWFHLLHQGKLTSIGFADFC